MLRVHFKDERDYEEFELKAMCVKVESEHGLTTIYNTCGTTEFVGSWQTKDIDHIEPL